MAGRPFNRGGNFPPRRTPCLKGRQSCREQDASVFRGHSCHLFDEDEFSGWRKTSSGFQRRSMWVPQSNGECVMNCPSRLNMRPSNRDSRSFSPCSCKEDSFISEVHRREQSMKYRRLEWVNPRRRVDSSTPHCDVAQNAGISDKEAPCNQRHPKRPIRGIYREPGFPCEVKMQRLPRMSNREHTVFRGDTKGKLISANQASRWMYANEHGQMSGPYSLNQLFEGLNNRFLPKDLPVHQLCHGDLDEAVPLRSLFEEQGDSHFSYSEETLNNENTWPFRQQAHSHQGRMQRWWRSSHMGDEFYSENKGPPFFSQQGHPSTMHGMQPFDEVNYSPVCFDGERSETSDRDGSVPPGFEAGVNGRTSFETSCQGCSGVTTAGGTHCWDLSHVHDASSNGGSNVAHLVDGFAAHDVVVGGASVDMGCHTNNRLDTVPLSGYDSPIQTRTSCTVPGACIGIPVNIPGSATWNGFTEAVYNDSPTSMNSLARSKVLQVPCSLDQGTGKSVPEEAGLNDCQCGLSGGKIEESADVIKLNAIMLIRKELLAAVKRSYCRTILSALISESLGLVDREFVVSKNMLMREEVHGTKAASNTKPETAVNGDLNSDGAASLSKEPSGLNSEGFGRVSFKIEDCGKLVSNNMLDEDGNAIGAAAAAACSVFKGTGNDFAKPYSANIANSVDDVGKGLHPLHLENKDREPQDVLHSVSADEDWKGNFKLVLPYLLQAQKLLLELDKSGSSSADMLSDLPSTAQSEALDLTAGGHQDESNVVSSTEKTVLAALRSLCSKQ